MEIILKILQYAIWACCAAICRNIAIKKGYNPKWAILWGILGSLIAVIVYACLSDKNKEINENKQ
jgi:hypothetical protein